jgi:biotin carboxyl carrier protein
MTTVLSPRSIAAAPPPSAAIERLGDHPGWSWPVDERIAVLADGVRRLAGQRDLQAMASVAAETACELVDGLRARCYLVDAEEALLWTPDGDERSIDTGLASAAARTRELQIAACGHAHTSYDREIDDPLGSGTERVAALPIVASDEVHAVVVVVRSPALAAFSTADVELLTLWGMQIGPLFHLLHVESHAAEAQLATGVAGRTTVFREEALNRITDADDDLGALLERLPSYLRNAHLLPLIVIAVAMLLLLLARVDEYASGPAFVAASAQRDVATTRGGVVEAVHVTHGDLVVPGELVATFSGEAEYAELARARSEFDRTLLARLREPSDASLELEVARARVELERAEAGVESVNVRASTSGRVADVRIEQGRAVEAGQVLLTIADAEGDHVTVHALIPGRYRPAIEVGQPLTLELDGFAAAAQQLTVVGVTEEVVGVHEIQRIVGPQIADVLGVEGPVVMVHAELHSREIEADGRSWSIHPGMLGEAEIAVRTKPLLYLLVPGLEEVLGDV